MSELLDRFLEFIRLKNLFSQKDRLLVAVSGGLDSSVLCSLCQQAGFDFVMAHANFHLRDEESDRDEAFVRSLAAEYGRVLHVRAFDTRQYALTNKCSIQVAARELRYAWFHSFLTSPPMPGEANAPGGLQRVDRVLTAHHRDDSIETLLINFFKGTGIAGLHGIRPRQGAIVRPLLFATKEDLETYAAARGLHWLQDSSNLTMKYTRNHLRLKLLPVIREVFPEAMENLSDNLSRFEEIETLYRQAIERHKKSLLVRRGKECHIPVLALRKAEPLHTIVFEIFREFGFQPSQVDGLIRLLDSDTGRQLLSSSHRVLKNRQWLIVSPLQPMDQEILVMEEDTREIAFSGGTLHFSKAGAQDYRMEKKSLLAELDADKIRFPLLLRRSKPGDYFYPLGMRKKKKISRFLIDLKLSLAEKEKIWVIEMQQKIIWVVGLRIDDRFAIGPNTRRVLKIEMRMP